MINNFCSNCGEPVARPDTKVCTNCGKPLLLTQTEPVSNENDQNTADDQRQNYNEAPKPPIITDSKSPLFAVLLSFWWVGLGQLYNGKFWKGLLFSIACMIGTFFLLFLPGLAVWIYACWDAYKDAEKINKGEIPFSEPSFWEIMAFVFFWPGILLLIFVILFAVLILLY